MSNFRYLSTTQLHEAQKQYLAFLEERGLSFRTEEIPAADALGRMSARAVYANLSSPH